MKFSSSVKKSTKVINYNSKKDLQKRKQILKETTAKQNKKKEERRKKDLKTIKDFEENDYEANYGDVYYANSISLKLYIEYAKALK